MKFLVPNYSCLQNSWLGGYHPQIPVLSAFSPQLNLLNSPPPKKIPEYATVRYYLTFVTKAVGNPAIIPTSHLQNPSQRRHCLGQFARLLHDSSCYWMTLYWSRFSFFFFGQRCCIPLLWCCGTRSVDCLLWRSTWVGTVGIWRDMTNFFFPDTVLFTCDVSCHLTLSADCRTCFCATTWQWQKGNLFLTVLK